MRRLTRESSGPCREVPCARFVLAVLQRAPEHVHFRRTFVVVDVASVPMSETVLELAQAIRGLPRRDVEELREWIEDYLEDQLEFTEEFTASIERGKKDITTGNVRIRNPEQA